MLICAPGSFEASKRKPCHGIAGGLQRARENRAAACAFASVHSATWWTWLTWLTWLTCAFASLHWSNGDWAWWRIGETQKKRERQGVAQPEAAQTRTETTYQSQHWGGRHSWAGWEKRQAGYHAQWHKDMNGNRFGQLYIVSVRMRQVRSVPLCFWLQCHGIAVSACLACFSFCLCFPVPRARVPREDAPCSDPMQKMPSMTAAVCSAPVAVAFDTQCSLSSIGKHPKLSAFTSRAPSMEAEPAAVSACHVSTVRGARSFRSVL